jgi:hypothetical protein
MYIANAVELKLAIAALEEKKLVQEKMLSDHIHHVYENLQPANLIRNTFKDITGSSKLGANLLDAGLGIGAGILSKKLFIRGSGNILRKIAGTLLELGIANVVAKNTGKIKDVGKGIIGMFSRDRKAVD